MSAHQRSGLKFGVFAIVMTLLTASLFVIFGQYRSGATHAYSAVFRDVSGLKVGDSVRAAGMRVGTVRDLVVQQDNTVVATFDNALRSTPFEEFVGMISGQAGLSGFLMTPDAAFGHNRLGTH